MNALLTHSRSRFFGRDRKSWPLVANVQQAMSGERRNKAIAPYVLHGIYNEAVQELSDKFFEANKLMPDGSNMIPDQARALLKDIRQSEDPRIRDFNLNIRRIQRLQRLRGGSDD